MLRKPAPSDPVDRGGGPPTIQQWRTHTLLLQSFFLNGWFHKQGFRGFKGEKGEPGLPGLDGLDAPCPVVWCSFFPFTFPSMSLAVSNQTLVCGHHMLQRYARLHGSLHKLISPTDLTWTQFLLRISPNSIFPSLPGRLSVNSRSLTNTTSYSHRNNECKTLIFFCKALE